MYSRLRDVVVQNVLPAYRDFFERRRRNVWGESQTLRAATTAAIALYHVREHLPQPVPSVSTLRAECPDYGFLEDITNVVKHRVLDRGKPRISRAEQICEFLTTTSYKDQSGEYWLPQVEVFATLDDGTKRNVAEILHAGMEMWCKRLAASGLMQLTNPERPLADLPVPRAVAALRRSPIEMIRGEDRQLPMMIRRYNYEKRKSEPVDLTGHNVEMRVFRPSTSIPLRLRVGPDGRDVDLDLPLSPEQQDEYVKLADNAAKEEYALNLIQGNGDVQRRLLAAIGSSAESTIEGGV